MKAKNNTLYYTGDFFGGKLIDQDKNILLTNYKEVELDEETCHKLLSYLSDYNNELVHRCMSVYRDAIIINDEIYNICLSCGDYYKGDEKFYIHNEKEIKEFLSRWRK